MSMDGHVPAPSPLRRGEPGKVYCLVPPARADALMRPLKLHFARQPAVEVLIERRRGDAPPSPGSMTHRAPVAERDIALVLPPHLQSEAPHLRLIQPLVPVTRTHGDRDPASLITEALALDPEATSELCWRLSTLAQNRLAVDLGRAPTPADTRRLLGRILDQLPTYDPAAGSLPEWLNAILDGYAHQHAMRHALVPPSNGLGLAA
jgi:hypothetical protein